MDIKTLTAATLAVAALASATMLAGEVEWTGASDDSFATGANWDAGSPPSSTDILLLEDEDDNGVIVLDQDYAVGGLYSRNPVAGRTQNYTHAIDLGGNRLTVAGPLHIQQYWNVPDAGRDSNHGDNYLVVSNGTFQVGTTSSAAEIIIGRSWDQYYYGHLTFGDGAVFDGHLGTVHIGRGYGGWGRIDFRGAAQIRCGDEIGVFRANVVELGYEGNGGHFRSNIEILFGSALTSFEVNDTLTLAWNEQNSSWIGQKNGYGTAPFPAGADVKFGVDSSRRAAISIGWSGYWPTYGQFAGPVGGDCTAWISTLTLASRTGGATGNNATLGILDLSDMDTVDMDVSGATQIGISGDSTHMANGRLALPSGTANFAGAVTLGTDYGWGELLLNGTTAIVGGGITVGSCGVVSNVVQGASCGLDVPANASFDLNGKMYIVFAQPDASNGANGTYWGFRIAGDQSVTLAQLMQAGKIVVDDTQIPGTANVFYDDNAGYTYIAHRASGQWAPTVVTKPLTMEVDDDVSTTFVIDRADIDLSPPQEGMTVTFTGPTDLTPGNPSLVTLPPVTLSAGDEPVQIVNTLTYASAQAGTTTADSPLTVTPLLPRSTANLTWTGGASLTHMSRPDWRWSANWSPATGGPAAYTPGTLFFNDTSLATNRVDCDRLVGGVQVLNTTGTNVFDLGGNTLAVSNHAYTATSSATLLPAMQSAYHNLLSIDGAFAVGSKDTVSSALVTGGTLAFRKGGLLLDSNGAGWSRLVVSNAVFDADCDVLRISSAEKGMVGYAALDLADATIRNGTIRAEILFSGYSMCESQAFSQGQLIVSANSGLTNVVATKAFGIGFGHRTGASRFGDPSNNWKLPANVSFQLGESAESRAAMYVGYCNWGGTDALLEASSGGTFSGWLSELDVGWAMPGSLRLAAMDEIDLDATTVTVAWGGFSGGNAEMTLPAGRVRCDNFWTAKNGQARVSLYGTTLQIDTEAKIGDQTLAQIDTYVGADDGLCGLRFGTGVTPVFGSQGVINLHFAAPAAKPCAGVCFEGEREAEVQALIDGGKITVDGIDGADVSKVKVFTFQGDTYVGFESDGGTIFLLR